jgi:AcrR family transcriptional regulator
MQSAHNVKHPRQAMAADDRLELILHIAQELFYERGYHAVSLRDLAAAVGLNPSSLYYYFDSKEKLLLELIIHGMALLTATTQAAIDALPDASPKERLRAAIRANVSYHIEHRALASLSTMEHRSLNSDYKVNSRNMMKAYERLIRGLIDAGVESGEFTVEDPGMATFLILTACARVSMWHRDSGRLSSDEIARLYTDMLMRMVSTA